MIFLIKRLPNWKKCFLFRRGRLTLIKSTLSNLLIYFLSVLTVPVQVTKQMEAIQNRVLWGDAENKRAYHLVNWEEDKLPMRMDGLGRRSITTMNKALHDKWIWRFFNKGDSLWKRIVEIK